MNTRSLLAASVVALGLTGSTMAAGEYYNGDPDLINGLSAETDTFSNGFQSKIYENFDNANGTVSDVFGNFFINTKVVGCDWEIRTGMSPGNGGTLLASGRSDFGNGELSVTPNGFDAFGFQGFNVALDIPDLALGNGQYWLGLSVVGSLDGGRAFAQETSGANSYGSPINDNQAIWNAPAFGVSYGDALQNSGQGNFSYGVNTRVPAPGATALLGIGGLVAARRRR
jgi:hypothetical protein